MHMVAKLEADKLELLERIAQLQQDKKRLDWLDEHAAIISIVRLSGKMRCEIVWRDSSGNRHRAMADTIREAIDKAMHSCAVALAKEQTEGEDDE